MPDFWVDNKPDALQRLKEQAAWWEMTYRDWLSILADLYHGHSLWDVGAGFGQFVAVARTFGWEAFGIEASEYAISKTMAKPQWMYWSRWDQMVGNGVDVISAIWVMEHLEWPGKFLDWAYGRLPKDGILLAVVPNEHTHAQRAANAVAAKKLWWIDHTHLSYWYRDGFHKLLNAHGFDVVDELGTYPMEEFILAGMDYTDDPAIGKQAHKKVEDMEMAMTREERLRIGRNRASRGEGRDLVVFARKR